MSRPPSLAHPDRHALYEAAVQGVEYDLDFFERVYRARHGHEFHRLREDFCGTAALAAAFVTRDPRNRAWGVDLDRPTLDWARRHRLPWLREAAARVKLVRRDVRERTSPKVDAVVAGNFSWWVFHTRRELGDYLRAVRRSLAAGGMFFAHVFGGTAAQETLEEKRRIPASRAADGSAVPGFTYVWNQESFNPIDHRLRCSITFRLRDGRVLARAFRYDWRLWSLPEVRELLIEAGFRAAHVYVEGWDDEKRRPHDVYRRRVKFENQSAWLAYVVGEA